MFRFLSTMALISGLWISADAQVILSGIVVDGLTGAPVPGVRITSAVPDETTSGIDGRFQIRHPEGTGILLTLEFNGNTTNFQEARDARTDLDLGEISIQTTETRPIDRELPTITLEEGSEGDELNISSLLQSGNELFSRLTNFTFSPARFRRRGLTAEYAEGYLNGIPMNDMESGGLFWNQWGGLNDVMRQDDQVVGAELAEWGFGGIGGTFNTDLRASSQWRQKRVSYALTNRNYRNRIMATWSTGMKPSGYAFTFSGSRRWAQEGFVDGTFYDAWAYFASVDKKFNDKHMLNLVVMGSPYERGGSSAAVQELFDITGDNYYNAYWGYQQGEKRSARIYGGHQPMGILRHDWTVNDALKITSSIAYQTGKSYVQALDWFDAQDPRPDYYRRLPSYINNPDVAQQIRDAFMEDPNLLQVQWDKLYDVNYHSQATILNANGIEGNTVTGRMSRYIMEERRSDINRKSGNITLTYAPSAHSRFLAGANAVFQDTRNYKIVADLLGGEFYTDWDRFAEQDFPGNETARQNDLLRPNRIVYEGDQFGWDYYSRVRQYGAWVAYEVELEKWELGAGVSIKNHSFFRDGQTQNGKFPDNSLGESEKNSFFLPSYKALIRYKIDGRNYITLSGMHSQMAPSFRNAYLSPRTRDNTVPGLQEETIYMGEARYDLRSPYLKMSVSGFYIVNQNAIETTSFYHDEERAFVNFSLTNIDRQFTGIEAAAEYTLVPGLLLTGAGSVGQYVFTSRPNATITQDNDGALLQENVTVYADNYYVSGTPQTAYTFGLTYRSKNFWSLYLNVNRFQDGWLDFNPLRRTLAAVDLVEPGSPQWTQILQQEELDGAWTIDLSFYKSWLVNWPKDRTTVALSIGMTNLLNNENYISGGFEQYRFDYETKDVNRFPSRYYYMQGINYYIQGSVRF